MKYDLSRWWYWTPLMRAYRVLHHEFYGMKGFGEARHYDPPLRLLPDHERFWRTHCFCCHLWLQGLSPEGWFYEPNEDSCRVLGYLKIIYPKGYYRYYCGACSSVYREGARAAQVTQETP